MTETTGRGPGRTRLIAIVSLGLLAFGAAGAAATRFEISGAWRGLYLLRSGEGRPFTLKDDLVLGDHPQLVASISFGRARRLARGDEPSAVPAVPGAPVLSLEWEERTGRGLVRNRLADGTLLVTMLGSYRDSDGREPQGLFVGGAVPEVSSDASAQNESGMAYRDARGWSHIWCNVNEGLEDGQGRASWPPSKWRFLGSRVLVRQPERVVLESDHELALTGGLLRVDRFATFVAGEPFFRLTIRLQNLGPGPVVLSYLYGDEPWLGHFGSSDGNIGWLPGALVRIAGSFDPAVGHAGIFDERTGLSNFLAWEDEARPSVAYFSNHPGEFTDASRRQPLDSNEVFIGLEWGGLRLRPGEGKTIALAVGMGVIDSQTGRPALPRGVKR
jgi:hypothetical protein